MINQDYIYEAVIGSGVAYSIKDWIKYCFDKYSLRWEEYILLDESYKSEYEILVSSKGPVIKYSSLIGTGANFG